MTAEIDQIVHIVKSVLTTYTVNKQDESIAPSVYVEIDDVDNNALTKDQIYQLAIRATTEANLKTAIDLILKLDSLYPTGYDGSFTYLYNEEAITEFEDEPANGDFKYPAANCVDLTVANWTVVSDADNLPFATHELITYNSHTNYLHMIGTNTNSKQSQAYIAITVPESEFWTSFYWNPAVIGTNCKHIISIGTLKLEVEQTSPPFALLVRGQDGNLISAKPLILNVVATREYFIICHQTGNSELEVWVFENDAFLRYTQITSNLIDITASTTLNVTLVTSALAASPALYLDRFYIGSSQEEAFGNIVADQKSFVVDGTTYYHIPSVNLLGKILLKLPTLDSSLTPYLIFTTVAASTATLTVNYIASDIDYIDTSVTLLGDSDTAELSGTDQNVELDIPATATYCLLSFSDTTTVLRAGISIEQYFSSDNTFPYHVEMKYKKRANDLENEFIANILLRARWTL